MLPCFGIPFPSRPIVISLPRRSPTDKCPRTKETADEQNRQARDRLGLLCCSSCVRRCDQRPGAAREGRTAHGLDRRGIPPRPQRVSPQLPGRDNAAPGRRHGLQALPQVHGDGGVLQEMGEAVPRPGRSLRRGAELRRRRHLPADRHQQEDRQAHRQARHVHRGQPPRRGGDGRRIGAVDAELPPHEPQKGQGGSPGCSTTSPSTSAR